MAEPSPKQPAARPPLPPDAGARTATDAAPDVPPGTARRTASGAASEVAPGAEAVDFERVMANLGMPWGREHSLKLCPGIMRSGRVLLGCASQTLGLDRWRAACRALGMPSAGDAILAPHWPEASVALFGLEPAPAGATFKVYLEFWDAVRQRVRQTRSHEPQLLHLGLKWTAGTNARHGLTRYHCLPLLTPARCLARMAEVMADGPAAFSAIGLDLVSAAARRAPREWFVYLEAEEPDSPRRSYDINLYKAGMTMQDAADGLHAAAALLGIDAASVASALAPIGDRPLGHISAGWGRDGQPFMTWYWEIEPMP